MRAVDLRDRYIKEAAKHHPDKGGDAVQFGKVHSAYSVLRMAKSRRQFLEQTIPCEVCKGKGLVVARTGFTGKEHECSACDGYGYKEIKDVVVL